MNLTSAAAGRGNREDESTYVKLDETPVSAPSRIFMLCAFTRYRDARVHVT